MVRKVIFVGSASFSGSTVLDMCLGNDPAGFSVGELSYYLNPVKPNYRHAKCGCGDLQCDIWPRIRQGGAERAYESIFAAFPEVNFIVDSSKDPFWIDRQTRYLARKGIETRRIVIWKTPLEIASSYRKRGRFEDWERAWTNYHRIFSSLFSEWRAIPYSVFANDINGLRRVCEYLAIPYFAGKERYWEKTHHLLFGNNTARVHLYEDGSPGFAKMKGRFSAADQARLESEHRRIYYRAVEDSALEAHVGERVAKSSQLTSLVGMLEARSVVASTSHWGSGRPRSAAPMAKWELEARRLKRTAVWAIGRWKYLRGNRVAPGS